MCSSFSISNIQKNQVFLFRAGHNDLHLHGGRRYVSILGRFCSSCLSGRLRPEEIGPAAPPEAVTLAEWPVVIPPETRPKASEESLAPGLWLGTRALELTPQVLADYLRDVRETAPIYAEQGIAHPGLVLRMCNWLLTQNVVLGPWIHIGSKLRFHGEARLGERLTARGRISANIERKGHRIVTIEALVLANEARPVARVRHEAIWRPRQVAEAGG